MRKDMVAPSQVRSQSHICILFSVADLAVVSIRETVIGLNPGLSQILSKVFLSKNMSLELTKYFCVFTPRFSDDSIEFYSR